MENRSTSGIGDTMTKTFITDKDGATIDASTATVPSDRHFRNAWKLSGSVISEDMTEAKKIFKDKIREVRKYRFKDSNKFRYDFCRYKRLISSDKTSVFLVTKKRQKSFSSLKSDFL